MTEKETAPMAAEIARLREILRAQEREIRSLHEALEGIEAIARKGNEDLPESLMLPPLRKLLAAIRERTAAMLALYEKREGGRLAR